MLALQTEGGLALIFGCACGHLYMLCNLFTFENSDGSRDGSTDWLPSSKTALVPRYVGAAAVISPMCKVAHTFLFQQAH